MANFIVIDNVGLIAIPDFMDEEDFFKYLYENHFLRVISHNGW